MRRRRFGSRRTIAALACRSPASAVRRGQNGARGARRPSSCSTRRSSTWRWRGSAGTWASRCLLQWVVDAYALTFAALQLSAGAACDRLGARSVHLLGLAVFGLLSAACALAPAGGALIAFRALQGVGAAAIVPASLAMLSLIHDRPADRARAIGLWGGAGGVAAAVGPVAGGLLVTFTGWRLVFWVNLPLVAAALWLTARCLPAPEARSLRRREGGDLPGQVLSVAGLAAATYGIIAAGEHGWSPPVVASTLAGRARLAAFVLVERTASRPMLPTAVFSRPRFAVAAAVGFALNTGFFGQPSSWPCSSSATWAMSRGSPAWPWRRRRAAPSSPPRWEAG